MDIDHSHGSAVRYVVFGLHCRIVDMLLCQFILYLFYIYFFFSLFFLFFFFQAEDGIRDLVRSRGLGDVYKRQILDGARQPVRSDPHANRRPRLCLRVVRTRRPDVCHPPGRIGRRHHICLLYTSDAADERSSVDLGGRRIIKKKNKNTQGTAIAREHITTDKKDKQC